MSSRDEQFLRLYQTQVDDRITFYAMRARRDRQAAVQMKVTSASLLAAGGLCGVLAGGNVAGWTGAWAVLSFVFPVIATSLAVVGATVFPFDRLARRHSAALAQARTLAAADRTDLRNYVARLEDFILAQVRKDVAVTAVLDDLDDALPQAAPGPPGEMLDRLETAISRLERLSERSEN
jgi:hypothetical protein